MTSERRLTEDRWPPVTVLLPQGDCQDPPDSAYRQMGHSLDHAVRMGKLLQSICIRRVRDSIVRDNHLPLPDQFLDVPDTLGSHVDISPSPTPANSSSQVVAHVETRYDSNVLHRSCQR